ncbi:hypothetical protein M422DRAFT_50104 [Sphaerobolus stellatus SS14]|uniref:Uncharacterized protein n=1 Tax=Sphaerobolus stellatus (strain SS14) TaxID=990650 RepID=A0A0C9V9I6_SPHS4|nr:hypothetical protein M422DRAFT_50104 [Sphaerobolus stellatus SS14]
MEELLDEGRQLIIDALHQDPIALAQDCVNVIRMSQVWHVEWLKIIKARNKKGKWKACLKDGSVVTGAVGSHLSHSNIYLKEPFILYMSKHEDAFKNHLTASDWTVLEHLCEVLETAYVLQEQMCKESTPMLACTLPAYECLISALETTRDSTTYSYLAPMIDEFISKLQFEYNEIWFHKTGLDGTEYM